MSTEAAWNNTDFSLCLWWQFIARLNKLAWMWSKSKKWPRNVTPHFEWTSYVTSPNTMPAASCQLMKSRRMIALMHVYGVGLKWDQGLKFTNPSAGSSASQCLPHLHWTRELLWQTLSKGHLHKISSSNFCRMMWFTFVLFGSFFLDICGALSQLPLTTPHPGPRSVILIDNAWIHHHPDIIELVESYGMYIAFINLIYILILHHSLSQGVVWNISPLTHPILCPLNRDSLSSNLIFVARDWDFTTVTQCTLNSMMHALSLHPKWHGDFFVTVVTMLGS